MLDRFKEFIGIDDNYDDYDDEQMYYDDEDAKEEKKESKTYSNLLDDDKTSSYSSNTFSSSSYGKNNTNTYKSSYTSSVDDNVVSMNTKNFCRSNNMRISIQEPLDYDNDGPVVIEEILKNRVVVLNLEMVDNDLIMSIFDFVSGGVYALKGNM